MNVTTIRAAAQTILDELGPAVPPSAPPIATADALDRALSAAVPGDTLQLDPILVYLAPLRLSHITLVSTAPAPGRMTRDLPAPQFLGGLALGDGVKLAGLEVRNVGKPGTDIVTISGADVWLDRVRVLGDPVKGAKRGIAANGGGGVAIVRCLVDDCFGAYPGDDTQAICAWDMLPGLLIEDCNLAGGSETVMIGGADSTSEARSPRQIVIRGNSIGKHAAWQAQAIGVKNVLELKNARDVTIEDNDIFCSWGGHGQDGYLLMLTVRNQGGKAPWSTVEDVVVGGNRFSHGAAAINVLARDNNQPSLTLARVQILENTFTDLQPALYGGSQRMILLNGGPEDLTIRGNTFAGVGMTSQVYFAGGPLAVNLNIDGNTWPKTKYGVFGTGATVGKAWGQFVGSGQLGPNTEA